MQFFYFSTGKGNNFKILTHIWQINVTTYKSLMVISRIIKTLQLTH